LLRFSASHADHRVDRRFARAKARAGVPPRAHRQGFPVTFGILPVTQDEYPLAPERVRYVGEPVAAVIGRDEQTAFEALDTHRCPVPAAQTSPIPRRRSRRRSRAFTAYGEQGNIHRLQALEFGDVNEALAKADHALRGFVLLRGHTHLPIEQHASVAAVDGEGKLTLWSSTQVPHYIHRALCAILRCIFRRSRCA